MNLPFFSKANKKTEISYFLALTLRDEQIGAYVLKEEAGKLHLVGKGEEILDKSIEQLDLKNQIDILDRIISQAESSLPKNVMTRKTMFGVKESWVEDNKIKADYLHKLKQICDELGLQPTGFLVISEAIAHRLQQEEGAPLTAILVEIGKSQMTVSHIKAGKILETKHTIIIESAILTLDALLKHFITTTVLPTRIILFDGNNTANLTQEFIAHQWSKSLPFLHMPQITPLPHGFDARSVILGAAEQMGLQVSSDINMAGLPEKSVESNPPFMENLQPVTPIMDATPNNPEEQGEAEPPAEESTETMAREFEKRLNARLSPDEEKDLSSVDESNVTTAEEFGFVKGVDISTLPHKEPPIMTEHHRHEENDIISTEAITDYSSDYTNHNFNQQEEHIKPKQKFSLTNMSFLSGSINKLLQKLFMSSSDSQSDSKIPRWMIIVPIVLLLIVAGIVWYIFNVKATVNLTLKPKIVEEQGNITFALGSGNDFSNNTLAASDVSVDLNGTASTTATGSKAVGSPAKGTVTIYNNSNSPETLAAGTTITSTNNLVFTFDNNVTVASASGDQFTGTKPGTADVNVTAKDIGQQYNLPSGTVFSINAGNSVAAKNNSAFSGGSKQTVTVVSQADINKLLSSLPQSLQNKAKSQLQSQISSGQTLLPGITSDNFKSKSFNHNIGDQANSVTLTGTVTFHGAAYNNQDLQNLAKTMLKDKFTGNSSLSDKGISANISNLQPSSDGKTIGATIDLQAGLLPNIDTSSLISQVRGKTAAQATQVLDGIPQIESSSINLSPNIPLIPKILPRFSNHITIKINSNG